MSEMLISFIFAAFFFPQASRSTRWMIFLRSLTTVCYSKATACSVLKDALVSAALQALFRLEAKSSQHKVTATTRGMICSSPTGLSWSTSTISRQAWGNNQFAMFTMCLLPSATPPFCDASTNFFSFHFFFWRNFDPTTFEIGSTYFEDMLWSSNCSPEAQLVVRSSYSSDDIDFSIDRNDSNTLKVLNSFLITLSTNSG